MILVRRVVLHARLEHALLVPAYEYSQNQYGKSTPLGRGRSRCAVRMSCCTAYAQRVICVATACRRRPIAGHALGGICRCGLRRRLHLVHRCIGGLAQSGFSCSTLERVCARQAAFALSRACRLKSRPPNPRRCTALNANATYNAGNMQRRQHDDAQRLVHVCSVCVARAAPRHDACGPSEFAEQRRLHAFRFRCTLHVESLHVQY